MMLIQKKARFFLELEFYFHPARNVAPALPLFTPMPNLSIYQLLLAAVKAGEAKLDFKAHDRLQITHIKPDESGKLLTVLFRRSDPDAAPPAIENSATGELRHTEISDDEQMVVSAHLIISLELPPGSDHKYRAVFEEVPGISRTNVETIIRNCIHGVKYSYTDVKGKPKEASVVFKMAGIPSETLGHALQNSVVPSVELVRPGKIEGMDTGGLVRPKDERLLLTVRATGENTIPLLGRIQEWAKRHDWPQLRVLIKMPEGRSRVVAVDRDLEAAGALFIRSELVQFAHYVNVCAPEIDDRLVAQAGKLLGVEPATPVRHLEIADLLGELPGGLEAVENAG